MFHTDRGLPWILLDYEPKLLDLVEALVVNINGSTLDPGRLVLYSTILLKFYDCDFEVRQKWHPYWRWNITSLKRLI